MNMRFRSWGTFNRRVLLALSIPLITAWTILVATPSFGQELDFRTLFSDAEYYFLYQDYQEALPMYRTLAGISPDNANVLYRIGLCYLNIDGIKHRAIPYLLQAAQRINPTYNEGSFREEGAPPNVIFYLGEAYRVSGQLEKAVEAYKQFRNNLDSRDVYNLDFVNQQISACENAIKMMQNPCHVSVVPIDLFPGQNKYVYNPVLSYDGKTMLVTVQEKFYNAIYWIRKDGEGWGTPINITLDLAVEGETFATSLNADGTELYLFVNERGVGNVFTSRLVNGKWQKISKLGRNINTRSWETHASVSPDGKMLLFASNRRGGYGGLDLYYSLKQPNGDWGPATNFGPTINTAHNEEAPFLSPNGNTLYFASQGHSSIGGYDIFYSQLIGDNEWATPTNLGYPINTPDDDLFYFPVSDSTGLVAIVQKDNPQVKTIHALTIEHEPQPIDIALEGNLTLSDGYSIDPSFFNISIFDSRTDSLVQKTNPVDSTGFFRIPVQPGSYRLTAQGEGYTPTILPIVIPESYSRSSYPIELQLVPKAVTGGEFLVIRSILFEFDCDLLSRDAIYELEKIYSLMEKYPSLIIRVTGHTDNMGSVTYNEKLSMRRAVSVIDYLTNKGVERDRLEAKAASIFENIAANYNPDGTDNPDGRRLNRRACLSVIKSDESVTIQEDMNVPEHLKPRVQKYTILLAPVNHNLSKAQKDAVAAFASMKPEKQDGFKDIFAYTLGTFDRKPESIHLLNLCIEKGFDLATIIGLEDLMAIIDRPLTVNPSRPLADDRVFTIQLLAHVTPIEDSSVFKGLNVTEIKGEDGMYRYIVGEYRGMNAANEEMAKVKEMGFEDAFIMNLQRYQP